nr:ImmA/IrrE family metallo-endopeptidase [uncultured Fluviicola sp.]
MTTVKNSSDLLIKQLAESISGLHDDRAALLESIIEDEGIELFYDDYGNSFDGMTFFDDAFYMHLNESRGNKSGTARGRFTLAHELGHYFIENHRIGLINGLLKPHGSINRTKQSERIEREADYFAACLLMPENDFKKEVQGKKFDFNVLEHLKDSFNVSLTATALRYKDIGNNEIMVIYAVDGKIKWKFESERFPYKYLAEKYPNIPENTLMDQCFKGKANAGTTADIWAVEWFDNVSQQSLQKKFKEHCIMHENKVLSVIWQA